MPERRETPERAYRGYPFRLAWDGRYVAGISKVSALTHSERAITLERGITCDQAFVHWVRTALDDRNSVPGCELGDDGSARLGSIDLREDMVVGVFDETGHNLLRYNIYRCRPSAFAMVPGRGTGDDVMVFSILQLEYERWESHVPGQRPT